MIFERKVISSTSDVFDMNLTPRKINLFLFFKLPAAFLTGVRVRAIDKNRCVVRLKHRWINQNPFRSIFWAVQGMAAELSTGALVMQHIEESGKSVSMLVASNKGSFFKKATGRVEFVCTQGVEIKEMVQKAIVSGEGQKIVVRSEGKDGAGDVVSVFEFEWTLKVRKKR